MRLKKKKNEILAYRGHAIERLDQEFMTDDIQEEHGTSIFYECGVSLIEEKEA